MTLGVKTTHFFTNNSKSEPKKRRYEHQMNDLNDTHMTAGADRHIHHQSYETPSKRSRSSVPTHDPNWATNTGRRSSFIKEPMAAIKDAWDRLWRTSKGNNLTLGVTVTNSDHMSTSLSPIETNVDNNRYSDMSGDVLSPKCDSTNTSAPVCQSMCLDDNRKHSLTDSYRLDEKSKYRKLLNFHLGTKMRFNSKKKVTNRSKVVVDLTTTPTISPVTLSPVMDQRSQQPYSVQTLDTNTSMKLVDRLKSYGIAANPTIRLNTSNITPFGYRGYQPLTPKPFAFSANETPNYFSSQTRPSIPESSKKFTQLTEQKRDYLDSKWTQELKSSLFENEEKHQRVVSKHVQRIWETKSKRETDFDNFGRKILSPINRTELKPFVPYYDTPFPEEEEDVEEETAVDTPELTPEMEMEIDSAFKSGQNNMLVDSPMGQIYGKDIQTLKGLNWLNDEIINCYLNLLVERGRNDNYKTVHAFNTFFYKKLKDGGPASLKRWTKKMDVFANDFIFIPIHLGMHWCLAVIDIINKRIQYFDSMGGTNQDCVKSLMKWLQMESKDRKGIEIPDNEWSLEMVEDIPQQMNGSDCGMFVCKFAEFISRGARITFAQAHMPYFRRRMVYEILHQRLL